MHNARGKLHQFLPRADPHDGWATRCDRGLPSQCKKLPTIANVVIDTGGAAYDGELISAARKAGLKVLLAFHTDEEYDLFRTTGIRLAQQNRDVVLGVCWLDPFARGHKPSDLSRFGQELKRTLPGAESLGPVRSQQDRGARSAR